MSFIKSIETNIKGWFKINFFAWIVIVAWYCMIVKLGGKPSEELTVWVDFGYEAFCFLFFNAILPYYIIKGIVCVINKYPEQAKLLGKAMVLAIIYKEITKK